MASATRDAHRQLERVCRRGRCPCLAFKGTAQLTSKLQRCFSEDEALTKFKATHRLATALPSRATRRQSTGPIEAQRTQSSVEDLAGQATVLLAEDNEPVRRLAARTLATSVYQVMDAATPEAALALARSEDSIDVLITDVVLPGMDGNALAEQLGRDRPTVPYIFM